MGHSQKITSSTNWWLEKKEPKIRSQENSDLERTA